MSLAHEMEVCPNCGEFAISLNLISGWCFGCSPPTCEGCGETFEAYGQYRNLCIRCRRNLWDERYADRIERYMAVGLTLTKARQAVKRDSRPTCLCCGEPILYGNPVRDRFCNRRSECKTSARRYKYYRKEKRLPPEEALTKVVELLTREKQHER